MGAARLWLMASSKKPRTEAHRVYLGSVVPSMKGSTASVKVLLAYGMQLASAGNVL